MNKKEAWGEVDFAGEEAAAYGYTTSLRENKQAHFPLSFRSSRGFLATAVEIGHCEVLLELVHNNENFNETIGPTCESGPELKFILCIESPARQ